MKFLTFLVLILVGVEGKNPGKAVLMSAFLPGGGQFYNEKYLKGFIVASVEVFTGYNSISRYVKYRKSGDLQMFNESLSYGFYFLGTWLYSLADAYVDAHLFNFKEKVELALFPRGVSFAYKIKWR
ncbi:MAG: DUF5683 domain-containing protein [bacterium]|nr:DUF5683 domain-containing protein [bacterium]